VRSNPSSQFSNLGLAWLLLTLAFAANFVEEALRGFLGYYNATVLTLYGDISWFPRIDISSRSWFVGSILIIAALLTLTPLAYRNPWRLRSLAFFLAGMMLLEGMGHILATTRGRIVAPAYFDGASPGFYTSPLLLMASVYLFVCLRRWDKVELSR
jgi:hypothetical protein